MPWRFAFKPLTTRLGLEVYALAAIPVIIVAATSLFFIQREYSSRAMQELEDSVNAYRQTVEQRLDNAAELLYQIGRQDDGRPSLSSTVLEDFVVYSSTGARLSGTLFLPFNATEFFGNDMRAKLYIDNSGPYFDLYLARSVGDRIVVGLLADAYVWANPAADTRSANICIFTSSLTAPLLCSAPMPLDVKAKMRASLETQGSISWQYPDETQMRSYWDALVATSIDMPALKIVASVPEASAMAPFMEYKLLMLPVLVATLVVAVLAGGVHSGRILTGLAQALYIARQFAAGNFDVRAKMNLERKDEFTKLVRALHYVAERLSQQFSVREALSQIDQIILAGEDTQIIVDLVLKTLVGNVRCLRANVFLIDNETRRLALKTEMSLEHPVPRHDEIEISEAIDAWLGTIQSGVLISQVDENAPFAPFIAPDATHTFVLPIMANGPVAGVVTIVMKDAFPLDDIEMNNVHVLAGRLAVALEAVARAAELHRKAYFDDLTGLPNRDFCFNRLDQALRQAKHLQSCVAVMFVDLDGFKGINDSLGHIAGDDLIRQAGYRLSACVDEVGTIGRLGGDEFAVVLPFAAGDTRPEQIADKALNELRKPFMLGTSEIHMSASIGIAKFPEDGDTRVELLRRAETAMYQAKESGRGQSADYSYTMGFKVDQRIQVEIDLRYALERDEFEIFYQPQMDTRTGRIVSAEALLRWNHPQKGQISPADFIPIAEETGYINIIGAWVMSNACRQLATWREMGLGIERVAVNVSAGQFRRHDFIQEVESCLLNLFFEPGSLELELTESVFVEDLAQAKLTLDRLKCTGVLISIDDFGTGYSSLGYLKHLTFDVVKVDQSFVRELPADQESAAIVHAVVAMSHTLGKLVVAEGVENELQFDYLREAGVDIAQGYQIGRPMPATDFTQWLKMSDQKALLFRKFRKTRSS